MATVSKPFVNASISPLKRALSWCPISPTKIALVYVATTGGSPRYFIQIVNFVDGVPVYGPPCLILLQAVANTAPSMRMVMVKSDRLLFSVPKTLGTQARSYSFVLAKLNPDDTVEFIAESPDLVTSAPQPTNSNGIIGLIGGSDGTAVVYGTVQGASTSVQLAQWTINTVGDVIAIGSPSSKQTGVPVSPSPYETIQRTALDGAPWMMQSVQSPWAYFAKRESTHLDFDNHIGVSSFSGAAILSGFLPIRDDKFLLLNGATAQLREAVRNTTTGALTSSDPTTLATINWRNSAEVGTGRVEDSIWLDADGTFVSAYCTGAVITTTDAGTSAETASTVAPLKLHIARYIEATQSIQQAADFPLDLNVNHPKRNWDRMLHRVDSKTIAVIGAFCPIGQFNVQHGIIMVKGD